MTDRKPLAPRRAPLKPIMRHWQGQWWCRRMGVTGCGATMREAWDDMWALYAEAIRAHQSAMAPPVGSPRA